MGGNTESGSGMIAPDINPVELKVFLNHIYELKKGVRQMVLYTTNRKYEAFAVRRLKSQRIRLSFSLLMRNGSICFSANRNVSMLSV